MPGYSGTPLPQKLGIKQNHRIALIDAPPGFAESLAPLPGGVRFASALKRNRFDLILCFVTSRAALEKRFEALRARLDPDGGLWVAWPKRASGVKSDIDENQVREVALAAGLVDNKVCAIDEIWSGLRCVVRLADRPAGRPCSRR
jgi:hypothetical protein